MNEPTAVVLPRTLKWPRDDVGERALLAFEVYDPTHFALEQHRARSIGGQKAAIDLSPW